MRLFMFVIQIKPNKVEYIKHRIRYFDAENYRNNILFQFTINDSL